MSNLIVLGVLIVMAFAVAYGLYTRTGSGIEPASLGWVRERPAQRVARRSAATAGEGSALAQRQNRNRAVRPSATQ